MDYPRPLFRLLSVFSNKHYNFYNYIMWKMSVWYLALGFEPTTSCKSTPITTRTGHSSIRFKFCLFFLWNCDNVQALKDIIFLWSRNRLNLLKLSRHEWICNPLGTLFTNWVEISSTILVTQDKMGASEFTKLWLTF